MLIRYRYIPSSQTRPESVTTTLSDTFLGTVRVKRHIHSRRPSARPQV